jgi:hypothetical protein
MMVLAGALAGALCSGCSSSGESTATSLPSTAPQRAEPRSQPVMNQAQAFTCATDRETLKAALDAYGMLNGGVPAADVENVLVSEGFLREPSTLHDIEPGTGVLIFQDPHCGTPGQAVP